MLTLTDRPTDSFGWPRNGLTTFWVALIYDYYASAQHQIIAHTLAEYIIQSDWLARVAHCWCTHNGVFDLEQVISKQFGANLFFLLISVPLHQTVLLSGCIPG